MPLFFFSDPPHLIKKLRNNIHSSGFKENHPRYTRTLFNEEQYILWDQIYAVYTREKKRHLYVTDLRKSHVEIDSFSKMRVKLAVQTPRRKLLKRWRLVSVKRQSRHVATLEIVKRFGMFSTVPNH